MMTPFWVDDNKAADQADQWHCEIDDKNVKFDQSIIKKIEYY